MKRPLMMFCILCMVICVLIHICKDESPPGRLPENKVSLQGRVVSMEDRYGQTILFLSDILFYGNSAEEISEYNIKGIMCYCEGEHELKLGQTVAVQGFLSLQEQTGNAGGFNAYDYYGAKGYEYVLKESEILKTGQRFDVMLHTLYRLKQSAKETLYDCLESGDAGIMTALLLGDKAGIESETKEAYRSAGIYHILAISGLHISLIGGFLFGILKKLRIPIPIAAIAGIGMIVVYGIMIGMPPSAFRAIFMFAVGVVAGILYRSHDRLTSLALSATCLILSNPMLIYEAGFQLSYLAVLGIVCLYPTFTAINKNKMPFLDSLWVSFAVTYFTLPAVMNFYYEVPVYSILLNGVILPFLPVLLGMGIVVVLLGNIVPRIASVSAVGIHLILLYYEKVLQLFDKLPGGNYVTGTLPMWKTVVFYAILGTLIYCVLRKKRYLFLYSLESENDYAEGRQELYVVKQREIKTKLRRMRAVQMSVMGALIIFLTVSPQADLEITFLDVGQGDGIYIEAQGDTYLIDCGSTSKSGIGKYTLLPFLKYKGSMQIDGWFLTHSDSDHVSAFTELCKDDDMQGIKVDTLYIPNVLEEEFEEVIQLARQHDINVELLERGEALYCNELKFTVLSPDGQTFYADENAASLVLYLEYGPFEGLFMGDAGIEAEQAVQEAGIDRISLLKVSHHGSAIHANSEAFIESMSPEISVISCGENNSYGHPHKEVLERLESCDSEIYRTDERGQICVRIRGSRVSVEIL